MITFENVNRVYEGVQALKNINTEFKTGEFICIVGTSGGGKTTLMRMINRMNEPSSGRVLINGKDICEMDEVELRRHIGYVIQNIGLFPHMTIRENIMLVPKLLKWTKEQKKGVAEALIQKVELPLDCLDRRPDTLSGGQQQRIGVIRALAANQEIILMDEPFSALDPITRDSLQNLVKKLSAELNKTVIFVTHDMEEALKLADRILVIDKGEILQFDQPAEILAHPATEFVQNLLGHEKGNILYSNQRLVKEIMNPKVKAIHYQKSITDALRMMQEYRIDSLMVIDDEKLIKGYVSLKDMEERNVKDERRLTDIMRADDSNINENEKLKDVVHPLLKGKFEYLPVVDNAQHLVGIITKGLLADLVYKQLA